MSTLQVAAAQAGDERAFRALVEPYRRALEVHCYRMLGSVHDAEDVSQDTLLRAWRSFERFEGRSSVESGCTESPPTPAWTSSRSVRAGSSSPTRTRACRTPTPRSPIPPRATRCAKGWSWRC
jgi:hypothetical protein